VRVRSQQTVAEFLKKTCPLLLFNRRPRPGLCTYFALRVGSPGGARWQTKSRRADGRSLWVDPVCCSAFLNRNILITWQWLFDTGKTFRDTLFPAYKATRAKMPDDLRSQNGAHPAAWWMPLISLASRSKVMKPNDVLGSVSRQAANRGLGVKLFTGDPATSSNWWGERIMVSLAGSKLSEAKDYFPEDVRRKPGSTTRPSGGLQSSGRLTHRIISPESKVSVKKLHNPCCIHSQLLRRSLPTWRRFQREFVPDWKLDEIQLS